MNTHNNARTQITLEGDSLSTNLHELVEEGDIPPSDAMEQLIRALASKGVTPDLLSEAADTALAAIVGGGVKAQNDNSQSQQRLYGFVEASCTGELSFCGGPSAVVFPVSQIGLLKTIRRLQTLCHSEGLSEIRAFNPAYWVDSSGH